MPTLISKSELMALGYSKYTSQQLIRQAKYIMVKNGYPFYNNKRLGRVPKDIIESILGCTLELEDNNDGKD